MPIGGMIEVPAAAISADFFAPHLDFLSIGTNDLIQYTFAIDRSGDTVNYLYDPLHPSVLQLIIGVIKTGKAASIPIAKCGEMAGDAALYALVIGSGSQGIWHAPLHTAWDQENRPHEWPRQATNLRAQGTQKP